MPTYTIRDPQSGRSLRLTADGPPPTEQEIAKAFLDSANATPLSEPETYEGGFRKGLSEGATEGAVGFGRGLARSPLDLARGVKSLVTAPLDTLRGAGQGILNLLQATPEVLADSLAGAQQIVPGLGGPQLDPTQPLAPASARIAQEPQAFGEAVGSQVGQMALTAKPTAIPRGVAAAGRGLQHAGRLPALRRASTYGAVGAGMSGNLPAAAAAAVAPSVVRGTGRVLERGGTAVAEGMARTGSAATNLARRAATAVGDVVDQGHARLLQATQRANQAPMSGAAGEGAVAAGAARGAATSLDDAVSQALQSELAGGAAGPAAEAPRVFPRVLSWKPGHGPTAESAQTYRQQFGSREAARRLKTTPSQIKELAPGESRLPDAARQAIDSRISGLPPEEAPAYLDAAPNDLAHSYIEEQLRRALANPPQPPR